MGQKKREAKSKKYFIALVFSVLALVVIAYGARKALRSPLFTISLVEIADLPDDAPILADEVSKLAAIPLGQINLFDFDISSVERRLTTHPWIRQAHIQKRFPQTVAISIELREPLALIQKKSGLVAYVDANGAIFGEFNLALSLEKYSDLPVLSNLEADVEKRLNALLLIEAWLKMSLAKMTEISTIGYDGERGFRVTCSYKTSPNHSLVRSIIQLGHEKTSLTAEYLVPQLDKLSKVIGYLSRNGIAARQIYADAGKKIVVKIARGS